MGGLNAECFSIYYEKTFHAAFFISRNKEIAEDATQEAFLKAYNKLKQIKDPAKIGPWLAVIAMNCARDILRKRNNFIPYENMDQLVSQDIKYPDEFNKIEIKLEVQKLLSSLTIEYRQVLVLRYYYDLPLREIAEYLGISEVAAKSRLHRSKAEVERIMKETNPR